MAALGSTLTQQTVIAADQEGETKRLDERMAVIRGQMDKAQTNKEYQAFLTELNTYKAQRDKFETTAIEALAKAEEIRKQLADLEVLRADREKVREHAAKEREERFKEIEGRLNELKSERAACVAEVPSNVMSMFQRLLDLRGDLAMGTVEVIDRKRHEYNCSACMMAIPIDAVSGLISNGRLTRCSSCECVLFLDETAQAALKPGGKKSAKSA
mgnify:FL=1